MTGERFASVGDMWMPGEGTSTLMLTQTHLNVSHRESVSVSVARGEVDEGDQTNRRGANLSKANSVDLAFFSSYSDLFKPLPSYRPLCLSIFSLLSCALCALQLQGGHTGCHHKWNVRPEA